MIVRGIFLSIFLFLAPRVFAANTGAQSITLDGRLYSDTTLTAPLLDATVLVDVKILDPSKACVLYEERQTVDTSATNGYYNIFVGSPKNDPKRFGSDPNNTMADVFQNQTAPLVGGCGGYTPATGDARYIRVTVTPTAGAADTLTPDLTLNAVPNAMVAETLQGLDRTQMLQVNTTAPASLSQANAENIFSTTNYPKLTALLGGTSTQYLQSGTDGALMPNIAGNAAAPTKGDVWFDTTGNTLKFYDGTTSQTVVTATGGTIGGSMAVNTTGNIATTGNVTGTNVTSTTDSTKNLILFNAGGTHKVTVTVPAALAADYSLTLPLTAPASNGMVLSSDTSGVLSWTAAGGANSFVNGGNSFAGAATLGTNDNNTLAFKTNNTTAMTIDTAGKVGIGIATPAEKISVSASDTGVYAGSSGSAAFPFTAGTSPVISVENTSSTTGSASYLELATHTGGGVRQSAYIANISDVGGTAPRLAFGVQTGANSYAEAMTIDHYGNVMVGGGPTHSYFNVYTSTGTTGYGNATVENANSGPTIGASIGLIGSHGGGPISTGDIVGEYLTGFQDSGFNQLIGSDIKTVATNATAGAAQTTMSFQTLVGSTLADRMVIVDGNVGIGQATPATKLDVNGSVRIAMDVTACAGGIAGAIRYNSGTVEFCNGASWTAFSAGGSGLPTSGGTMTGQLIGEAGIAASPSFVFNGDTGTGFYDVTPGTIGIASGGLQTFTASGTSIAATTTGGALITSGNGTAAAPAFSFTGDAGTGWFRPAAGTLAASTGGSERVRIDSSGNFGIGTTAPLSTLQVGPSANNASLFQLVMATYNASSYPQIVMNTNATNWNTIGSDGTNALIFGTVVGPNTSTWASKNMVITQTGSVGIGTTTPTGTLDVEGGTATAGSGTNVTIAAQKGFQTGNTNGGNIILTPGAGHGTGSSGGVGIGTSAPKDVLDVNGSILVSMDNEGLTYNTRWSSPNSLSLYNGSGFLLNHNGGSNNLEIMSAHWTTAGSVQTFVDAINISQDANVGFGNATVPVAQLHQDSGNATATAHKFTAGTTTGQTATDGFDVGIDSSGNAELRQRENLELRFFTNNTERMTILANGNVGIGTASPGTALDVNGGIRAGAATVVTATCNAANEGIQRYNYTSHAMEFCNGTSWLVVGAAATAPYVPTSVVTSATSTKGDAGSYAAMSALCSATYHMCTGNDIAMAKMNSVAVPTSAAGAWYASGLGYGDSGGNWVSDCDAWTATTYSGPVWRNNDTVTGDADVQSCNTSLKVLCCK